MKYFEEINEVPDPYNWTYRLHTIDLSDDDVGTTGYEVVYAKAARPENQGKRAPNARTRTPRNQITTNA